MLPKELRLSRSEFPQLLSNGLRFNSKSLLLYIVKNNENLANNKSKFSFSISKKIALKATLRNKYRRRGYSAINKHLKQIKGGYKMFFVYKKNSIPLDYNKLESEIIGLLGDSGVLI